LPDLLWQRSDPGSYRDSAYQFIRFQESHNGPTVPFLKYRGRWPLVLQGAILAVPSVAGGFGPRRKKVGKNHDVGAAIMASLRATIPRLQAPHNASVNWDFSASGFLEAIS
jgi:hypothetical protein